MKGEQTVSYVESNITRYVWGLDISGQSGGRASSQAEMQGAGGVGGLCAVFPDNGITPHYPCYDANGNVTEYVDITGNTVAHYEYDAFGNITGQSGSMADDFKHRFSTKYWDAETGNIHFDHRPYKPSFGRFISRDPIEEQGGLNLYGFCGNDPVNRVDYLGLKPKEITPEGTYVLRGTTVLIATAKFTIPPPSLEADGFEVEYIPDDTCQCRNEEIRLIQAISTTFSSQIDLGTQSKMDENRTTPKGIPIPSYVQGGGSGGNHGFLSYIDAPYNQWNDIFGTTTIFNFETCALCPDNRNLGCVTFSFVGGKTRLLRIGGKTLDAESEYRAAAHPPTRLWKTAEEKWTKAAGTKKAKAKK